MAEYIRREDVLSIINASCFDLEYNSENIALQEEIKLIPAADVVERTLFDERMAEYQEALDKANEKLAYITGTDDYHYDLEYGREQLNSYVSALVYEKTRERKKGKWISHLLDDGSFWANYCSECGVYLPYGLDWKPNGCPNCFADMRGDA